MTQLNYIKGAACQAEPNFKNFISEANKTYFKTL